MARKATKRHFNVEDAAWVNQLCRVLDEFRAVNPTVTANQILTLLHIGTNEGVTQVELQKPTGLDRATISRICAVFSGGVREQPGLGLIRDERDVADRRLVRQYLTSSGRDLIDRVRTWMTA